MLNMIRLKCQPLVSLLLFLVLMAGICQAQKPTTTRSASGPCAMPPFSTGVNEPNIFSEQQEGWLGDILIQKVEREFHAIADPDDYVQKLGDTLLAQLPPTKTHYRFTIIDLPGNDSFGTAGGYIYLSRRIIALAQNEDEIAGLLGHEIGHVITHQVAIDFTQLFRTILGVTEVGDRKDLFDKWNRLLDLAATRDSKFNEERYQQEQLIADRIALYAATRAGYQPARFADFFDRLAQTKGNKGSFWSDFFGRTSPEAKRLREMVRNSAPLPQECVTLASADASERFQKWQKAVIESKFVVAKEQLPGLLKKTSLNPPLREDLRSIQFSPDGKYLLAQDESSIFVMGREPLRSEERRVGK